MVEKLATPVKEEVDRLHKQWAQLFQDRQRGAYNLNSYRERSREIRKRISQLTGEREFLIR